MAVNTHVFFKNLAYVKSFSNNIAVFVYDWRAGITRQWKPATGKQLNHGSFPGLARTEEHRQIVDFLWVVSQKSRENLQAGPGGAIEVEILNIVTV